MQNSHNTNIQTWLTDSKPMNEKKNTFQFGFQINSLYNNNGNNDNMTFFFEYGKEIQID